MRKARRPGEGTTGLERLKGRGDGGWRPNRSEKAGFRPQSPPSLDLTVAPNYPGQRRDHHGAVICRTAAASRASHDRTTSITSDVRPLAILS